MMYDYNIVRCYMKKALIAVMFLMSFASYSYAEDMWINLGYSYYLPEESSAKAPVGPVNLTIGGQVTDWVAIDFSIGYL